MVGIVGIFALGLFLALGATRAALLDGRRDIPAGGSEAVDELVSRVTGVAVISTAVALAVVGGLTWWVLRRGLRPLEDISVTAASIDTAASGTRIVVETPGVEIRRLADTLNAMLAQLETEFDQRRRSEDRLRRFVADASHELRTPIASVRGYAELFRRGGADDPAELARILARIEAEAQRMGILVDELLLLARLDEGRPLERQPVDLREVVADAVVAARVRAPDRAWRLTAEEPIPVIGDADRLRRVADNLLSNVIVHTPTGTSAAVGVTIDGGSARLVVRDEGPGLPEADRQRVFDRFFRAAGSGGESRSGTGLGLSIVAAVVEAHGGSVQMESVVGEGVSVIVMLPIAGAQPFGSSRSSA